MKFEEGMKIIEDTCGNNKDNVISLSTISTALNEQGNPVPWTREVDAFYDDGVFYITTWGQSNKILQIEKNNEVSFSVNFEGITGNGIGKNLGWILDPKNSGIRLKVRNAFSDWYDQANHEENKNCVILAIYIKKARIFRDHGATRCNLNLEKKMLL
jgi:general stress protein 26